jgi:hypothetical protein
VEGRRGQRQQRRDAKIRNRMLPERTGQTYLSPWVTIFPSRTWALMEHHG